MFLLVVWSRSTWLVRGRGVIFGGSSRGMVAFFVVMGMG